MRNMIMSVIIGLGLVVGFGFSNEVYACDDCSNEETYMTQEQLMQFDQAIYDMYCEEYCTNYCEECEVRYYEECMCTSVSEGCGTDCEVCIYNDYEIFIEDNYDMIMDIYEDIMNQLEEYRIAKEKEETVMIICEF